MAEGQIIKALSGFYYVKSGEMIYACKGRGVFRNKKIHPLVGDEVVFDITENDEGYITEVKERTNAFIRPPVANISQAIVVNAVIDPDFSSLLLDRFLVVLEHKQITPLILLTKLDLANEDEKSSIASYKADYEQIGYQVLVTSLKVEDQLPKDMAAIREHLNGEITMLVGQSGVGKSSLLNAIHPNLALKTGEISRSLGRGKHTTRHVELIEAEGGLVADTPGFSVLDFSGIEAEDLGDCFKEIQQLAPQCKFRSCLHDREPHCAVKQAVEEEEIKNYRYEHYLSFLQEILTRKPRYST